MKCLELWQPEIAIRSYYIITTRKRSFKILDTSQEKARQKGHFPCMILAPNQFLTSFLLLAKNCARNVKFLAQFLQVLQVSCKKGDIFSAHSVHRMWKHLQFRNMRSYYLQISFTATNNVPRTAFYGLASRIGCYGEWLWFREWGVIHMKICTELYSCTCSELRKTECIR